MIPKTPPCPRLYRCRETMAEKSFRRGYQHGWLFALRALENGATPEQAKLFALTKLQDWRYSRRTGMVEPPELKNGL